MPGMRAALAYNGACAASWPGGWGIRSLKGVPDTWQLFAAG